MAAELVTADGEVLQVARRFVLNRQGKDYVTYPGLVDLLHRDSGGCFAIETQLVQVPGPENGHVAICTARVLIYDPTDPDVVRRVEKGIRDADESTVGRGMAPSLIRLAETRAKARALRDAVNVAMVAAEELGPEEPTAPPARFDPPVERIQVDGKPYTRVEVRAIYAKRVAAAQEAGLTLAPADVVADDAPLAVLVAKAQELRRRLEVRAGARSAGK